MLMDRTCLANMRRGWYDTIMNTPTHFLITYSLGRMLRLPRRYGIRMSSVVWGSLAPDLLLYILSVGAIIYYRFAQGWELVRIFDHMFDTLFFLDIWWIVLHNVFQAPLILIAGILTTGGILWARRAKQSSRGHTVTLWIFVFCISALLHTVLDILTHHDDGPLLLFPFNFTVRFYSPVSYWDPDHYGLVITTFEVVVDILCIVYLIYLRRTRKKQTAERSDA